jgi:multidrug transporter EmrE-like cation transporter
MKTLLIIFFCTLYAVLNVSGAAIIKKELLKFQIEGNQLNGAMDFIRFLFRIYVIMGFAIILVSALVMFKTLSLSNFSFVVPMATGVNFVLTVVLGVFIFGDRITLGQYFGLLLIIAGIITISLTHKTA